MNNEKPTQNQSPLDSGDSPATLFKNIAVATLLTLITGGLAYYFGLV